MKETCFYRPAHREKAIRSPDPLDGKPDSAILHYVDKSKRAVRIELQGRWLLGLIGTLAMLQAVAPHRAWVMLIVGIGGGLGLGYLWARNLGSRIAITREQFYGWVHVGDLLEERFTLDNGSALPAVWVEIDDHSTMPGYSACSVRSVGSHEKIQWRTEGLCRQRGVFTLGPWQVRCSDPFGFWHVTLNFPDAQSILIYPPVVHLPPIELPKGTAAGAGHASQQSLESTNNAGGVRPYLAGDSLSRVHWRSTARLDSLMVKTFDLEPSGNLWIVLDMDAAVQAGEGEESTEEYGIILAGSLATRFLAENRAVGLAAYGWWETEAVPDTELLPTIVRPQKGETQQWRILQALAAVQAGSQSPLEQLLSEIGPQLGRGMTLVVITASCNPAWIAKLLPPMRRGVSPAVIILDPQSFGKVHPAEQQANSAAMIGLLADLGIPAHQVTKGMPFVPIRRHRRIGRPEYKTLSGTGRVLAIQE